MRNAMNRGDLGKAQELLQTLRTRIEGHDVMLEEAAMLEELLERRSRQDAQKRIQKQQPTLASKTTTTTTDDGLDRAVPNLTEEEDDINDSAKDDDGSDDNDPSKTSDLQLLALRATRSLTENLEAMWIPMSAPSKIQKLKLLAGLVSGVLQSISHPEIKGEPLTYEQAKIYLNGPLEKFAAKPTKIAPNAGGDLKEKSSLGKSLLQQHL